mgnify:CR=1 FL=1
MAKQKSTMIEEFFPSPRKKTVYQYNPPATVSNIPTEFERASKRKLTVEEYRNRVAIVNRANLMCGFKQGDLVSPAREQDEAKYGHFRIVGIVKHFDDYGDVDWSDPPMILQLEPMDGKGEAMTASVPWVKPYRPVLTIDNTNLQEC